MTEIPKLTLGTAQLGPAYGIANREGHLSYRHREGYHPR